MEAITPQLKIHCCCYTRGIWPWVQEQLFTPYWRFYYNPVPGGFLRFDGEEIALEPDSFCIIPGYLEFSTFAREPFEQFYIHFNPDDRVPAGKTIHRLPADPAAVERIGHFARRGDAPESGQLRMLAALSVLSGALLRLPEEVLTLPDAIDPRIAEAKILLARSNFLADNETLAKHFRMNPNSFIRLFASELRETPQLYCRRKRIERACELLHFTGRSIDEIAELTGFADRYHFSRVFSRLLRTSPAAFRRQRETAEYLPPKNLH